MFPVARSIFIGKTLLGYTEREVWNMTLRKLFLMYDEYKKEHGIVAKEETIEDLVPF